MSVFKNALNWFKCGPLPTILQLVFRINKLERITRERMKKCEMCTSPASMFCESDEASLCWDCDEKVHSANFLVAKHSRFLLCHLCQSPTPWQAAGPKLSPTVSVCLSCAENPEIGEGESQDEYEDDDNMDSDQVYSESDDDEEEDGDNQVVPLSSSPSPSPVASSSGSKDISSSRFSRGDAGHVFSVKRMREDAADLDSQVRTSLSL